MNEVINCNQCHNACKLDEVRCGRGEKYRDYIQGGGDPEQYVPQKGERHGEGDGREMHGNHGGHHHHHHRKGNEIL